MLARLLVGALALASTAQIAVASCGFAGLDFTSLMGTDLMGGDGTSPAVYDYYLSVCGALSSTATQPCTQIMSSASACQIQVSGGTGTFDVGNWVEATPPTWGYIDPNNQALGVMYNMMGAQSCWAHPPVQSYQANVLFVCSHTGTTGPLSVTVPQGSCIQNYTYPTPLACAGAGPSGGGGDPDKKKKLSGGWIFIIILCVVIPLYVVGGCVYKSQKLGATGLDKCPNVEFWRDLPGLVKDGCGFTYRKLRGLCAGGGGGKDGSYETM